MIELSGKTNLLEQDSYKYSLQDIDEPNLYRDFYSYTDVPRIAFTIAVFLWGCRRISG